MQDVFAEKKYPAFIGSVYGAPSFSDAVEDLVRQGARRAKLLPLMLVAGDHAKKDMAGGEGSLLAAMRDAGVLPEPVFRGLGESARPLCGAGEGSAAVPVFRGRTAQVPPEHFRKIIPVQKTAGFGDAFHAVLRVQQQEQRIFHPNSRQILKRGLPGLLAEDPGQMCLGDIAEFCRFPDSLSL